MPYKWTPGPGYASFELNGKTYQPGDMIPITKESALHHMKFGHNFEGLNAPPPSEPASIPAQVAPAPAAAT